MIASLRSLRAAAAVAAVALVSALPLPSVSADPFEINVILPLTGAVAFLGQKEKESLDVIEATVNRAGGVRGRPIKFVYYDDQSTPPTSVQIVNQIMAKHPAVILGSSFVSTCSADAPLVENTGPVMYCFSPGIYPKAGSYVFSASMATTDLLATTARYYRERGWKKVAMITSTDASGQDGERQVNTAFSSPENKDMAIVDREHFNTTDISVAAQMTHIKQSGAQAMIAWMTGAALATILHGMQDAGLDIPMTTSTGNLLYKQLEGYSSFIPDNVLFPAAPGDALGVLPRGGVHDAVGAYLNAMKAAGFRPDQGNTLSWDAAQLVLDAYKKYGFDMTPAQLRDYLASVKGFTGINGEYDFSAVPQRGLGPKWVIMVRWDKTKDDWVAVSAPGGMPLR